MKKTISILSSPISFPTISIANLLAWRSLCIKFCFLALCLGAVFPSPVSADYEFQCFVIRMPTDNTNENNTTWVYTGTLSDQGNFTYRPIGSGPEDFVYINHNLDNAAIWGHIEGGWINTFSFDGARFAPSAWASLQGLTSSVGGIPITYHTAAGDPSGDCPALPDPCDGVEADNDGVCDECDSETSPDCQTLAANPDTGCSPSNKEVGSSVNIANGNLFDDHDISPDANLPITLYYNSKSEREGLFGYGWNTRLDIRLLINSDDSVVLIDADGREDLFTANDDGSFTSPVGNYDILAKVGEEYQLTRKNGETVFFNADGKPVQIEDRNGNATTFGYDGDQLLDIIGPNNQVITFTSDTDERVTSIADDTGKSTAITYDAEGNLTSFTNAAGQSWTFAYDAEHNIISKTDPLGQTTQYNYNSDDQLLGSTDAAGNIRGVEYVSESVTKFTDPAGNTTEYNYNENQNITKEVDALGNTTEYTWDENRNKTSITDGSGTINYTYDANGDMLSKTDQQGNTTSYTYDSQGNILTVTDPQGNVTENTYDAKGNLISTTDTAGNTTQFQYDDNGRIIKITDANNRVTTLVYDAAGNVVSMTDPTGATGTMTYDASGNMVTMTDSTGSTTTFTYDTLNRPITVTDAKDNVTIYGYDAMGNRTSVTDANGNTTSFAYDHKQRIIKIIDALGQPTTLTYAVQGCASCTDTGSDKPTSLTDAKANITYFIYDALGRLIQETTPLGNATTYGYDAKGNLVARTDAKGNTINYTYDALGRLLSKSYPDQTVTSFTYDNKGNVITAANQHISYAMEYDTLGRLTKITDSNDRAITYKYDALGNRIQMITPDGETVDYTYDEGNRLNQIVSFAGVFDFTYDDLGRRTSLTHPNGVTTNYTYDTLGRLTEILTQALGRKGKTDIINAFTYSHDNVGNRLSKTVDTGRKHGRHHEATRYDYSYDAVYQLVESLAVREGKRKEKELHHQSEAFAYDPVGNRESGPDWKDTYVHNDGNQMLNSRKYDYQYDENGNMIAKTGQYGRHYDQDSWTYEYDYENRLIKVTKVEEDEIKTVTFKYDPFGRRIEKRVEEIEKGDIEFKTYTYVYDNEDIILMLQNGSDDEEGHHKGKHRTKTRISRFVHGPSIDEPLAIEQKGKLYFYHADGLGSITSLTDHKAKVVQSYEYTAFGEMKHHGGKVKQPYTYTGREWDKETGLYFYRARYYDPYAGRFISQDPIGFAGGDVNLYGYVGNASIGFIDPLGLDKLSTIEGIDTVKKMLDALKNNKNAHPKDLLPNPTVTLVRLSDAMTKEPSCMTMLTTADCQKFKAQSEQCWQNLYFKHGAFGWQAVDMAGALAEELFERVRDEKQKRVCPCK